MSPTPAIPDPSSGSRAGGVSVYGRAMPARAPLDGVRVVDLSQVVSGPFATMILAEQGADVVKVEPIDVGDALRVTNISRAGYPAAVANVNRGKRSIAVDPTIEVGRDIVLDLIAEADVVVQNFRPGVVDRLGIGYDAATARRADIVYVSISGYGPDGPYADRPVYDPVIQGLVGVVARQQSDIVPIPDLVRNIMFDKATAMTVAQSTCAALFSRAVTGRGEHVEISMLDVGVHFFWPDGMADFTFVGDDVVGDRRIVDGYRITHCADGQLIYILGSEKQAHALFRALDRAEMCDDPRFATLAGIRTGDNRETMGAILEARFAELPMREALDRLHAHGVAAGPINEPHEVLVDPQVVHNDTLVTWEHPVAGTMRQPRSPVRVAGERLEFSQLVAAVGEHTDEILAGLGRTDEQIADLRSSGVVA